MPAHAKAMGDLALTPDKKTLITADEDGEIKIWDLEKRESGEPFTAHKSGFMGIMISPNGNQFATMSRDGQCDCGTRKPRSSRANGICRFRSAGWRLCRAGSKSSPPPPMARFSC